MKNYVLKKSVTMEVDGQEFSFVDTETGFRGKGNLDAYSVFELLRLGSNAESIVCTLKERYPKSQYPRLSKAIPKIIEWALVRGIVFEVDYESV